MCLFTLNGKVRLVSHDPNMKSSAPNYVSKVHPLSFQMAGRVSCAPQWAHKCSLLGLWSELTPSHGGGLLFSHQMTFTATYPGLLDPHII